jgi:predicted transcriptional regulator
MAEAEIVTPDEQQMLTESQRRAGISAFLNTNPGPHNIGEIEKGTGLTRFVLTPLLAEMADQGQIHNGTRGNAKLYSSEAITPEQIMGETRKKAPRKAKKAAKAARVAEAQSVIQMAAKPRPAPVKAKEIELVIDGILIIAGRNPATGRLRVVLEG